MLDNQFASVTSRKLIDANPLQAYPLKGYAWGRGRNARLAAVEIGHAPRAKPLRDYNRPVSEFLRLRSNKSLITYSITNLLRLFTEKRYLRI